MVPTVRGRYRRVQLMPTAIPSVTCNWVLAEITVKWDTLSSYMKQTEKTIDIWLFQRLAKAKRPDKNIPNFKTINLGLRPGFIYIDFRLINGRYSSNKLRKEELRIFEQSIILKYKY
jgi:hypothetical protein